MREFIQWDKMHRLVKNSMFRLMFAATPCLPVGVEAKLLHQNDVLRENTLQPGLVQENPTKSLGRGYVFSLKDAKTPTGESASLTAGPPNFIHLHSRTTNSIVFSAAIETNMPNRIPLLSDIAASKAGDSVAVAGLNSLAIVALEKGPPTNKNIPPIFYSEVARTKRFFEISPENTPEFFQNSTDRPTPRVEWSKDERMLITVGYDYMKKQTQIRFWDTASGKQVLAFSAPVKISEGKGKKIGFSGDGNVLYVITEQGVEFFDLLQGQHLHSAALTPYYKVKNAVVSDDLRAIVYHAEFQGRDEVFAVDVQRAQVVASLDVSVAKNIHEMAIIGSKLMMVADFNLIEWNFTSDKPKITSLVPQKRLRENIEITYQAVSTAHIDKQGYVWLASPPFVEGLPNMDNLQQPQRPFGEDVLVYHQ